MNAIKGKPNDAHEASCSIADSLSPDSDMHSAKTSASHAALRYLGVDTSIMTFGTGFVGDIKEKAARFITSLTGKQDKFAVPDITTAQYEANCLLNPKAAQPPVAAGLGVGVLKELPEARKDAPKFTV
jgi:hypothetical protein